MEEIGEVQKDHGMNKPPHRGWLRSLFQKNVDVPKTQSIQSANGPQATQRAAEGTLPARVTGGSEQTPTASAKDDLLSKITPAGPPPIASPKLTSEDMAKDWAGEK